MNNKVLVDIYVPQIEETYNVFLPVGKQIGNVLVLLTKAIYELSNDVYEFDDKVMIYNKKTGSAYDLKMIVKDSDIRNGTELIIL